MQIRITLYCENSMHLLPSSTQIRSVHQFKANYPRLFLSQAWKIHLIFSRIRKGNITLSFLVLACETLSSRDFFVALQVQVNGFGIKVIVYRIHQNMVECNFNLIFICILTSIHNNIS